MSPESMSVSNSSQSPCVGTFSGHCLSPHRWIWGSVSTHRGLIPASVLAYPTALDQLVPSKSPPCCELLIQGPSCSFLIPQPQGRPASGCMVSNCSLALFLWFTSPVVKVLVEEEAQVHTPEIRFWLFCIPWATVAVVFLSARSSHPCTQLIS